MNGRARKRGSGWKRETAFRPPIRRKALKGEAHERWGLKDAPEDGERIRHEGDQTHEAGLPPGKQSSVGAGGNDGGRKGSPVRETLKGRQVARCADEDPLEGRGDSTGAAHAREGAQGGVEAQERMTGKPTRFSGRPGSRKP